MKRGEGFTIIELIVTITVMVILMTIVTVRLVSTQAHARDEEREIDITTIAKGLEVYYQNGSSKASIPKGYYPGGQQIQDAAAESLPFGSLLEGVGKDSFQAPRREINTSFGVDPVRVKGTNPDGSYSDAQARSLLATYPYLYQPLKRDNTFCINYSDCVKFNLYYLSEADDTVHIVRSKHQ